MSKKIHDLRIYLGLSLRSFGSMLGYSGENISRIEKNNVDPDERLIRKICDVFRVEPAYFTGEMNIEQAVSKIDEDQNKIAAAQRLKVARQEKGLSMRELSKMSGISQPQISMLEKGNYQLKRKAATRIAEVLEVGFDWILIGDERKKNYPADQKLVDWLWEHPEVREELWKQMKNTRSSSDILDDKTSN